MDEILDFIESVSEDFPTYSYDSLMVKLFSETGTWSNTGHPIRTSITKTYSVKAT